jgi:chromosomal replication initiator protein
MSEKENIDTATAIIHCICDKYSLTSKEILSNTRTNRIAHPRMMAMALIRRHTTFSTPKIAEIFRKRDHGTVLHATKRFGHINIMELTNA